MSQEQEMLGIPESVVYRLAEAGTKYPEINDDLITVMRRHQQAMEHVMHLKGALDDKFEPTKGLLADIREATGVTSLILVPNEIKRLRERLHGFGEDLDTYSSWYNAAKHQRDELRAWAQRVAPLLKKGAQYSSCHCEGEYRCWGHELADALEAVPVSADLPAPASPNFTAPLGQED